MKETAALLVFCTVAFSAVPASARDARPAHEGLSGGGPRIEITEGSAASRRKSTTHVDMHRASAAHARHRWLSRGAASSRRTGRRDDAVCVEHPRSADWQRQGEPGDGLRSKRAEPYDEGCAGQVTARCIAPPPPRRATAHAQASRNTRLCIRRCGFIPRRSRWSPKRGARSAPIRPGARLWCARFMNMVLQRSGHRGSGSDLARSFASYGRAFPGRRSAPSR